MQVVAHSNGGLVTFVTMNRRPELFHSVVFAGVPFHGFIGAMTDFHLSKAVGLNYSILSKKVIATFPTTYSFFSLDPNESGLLTVDGKHIPADMFSVGEWKFHRLGFFSPPKNPQKEPKEPTPEQLRHMRKCLKTAKRFRLANTSI